MRFYMLDPFAQFLRSNYRGGAVAEWTVTGTGDLDHRLAALCRDPSIDSGRQYSTDMGNRSLQGLAKRIGPIDEEMTKLFAKHAPSEFDTLGAISRLHMHALESQIVLEKMVQESPGVKELVEAARCAENLTHMGMAFIEMHNALEAGMKHASKVKPSARGRIPSR